MNYYNYILSFFIGFFLAMPTGPVGLLIFRNTLTTGPVSGIITLAGQVMAKTVYLIILVLGLSNYIIGNKVLFSILSYLGALTIVMLAIKFISENAKSKKTSMPIATKSLIKTFSTASLITIMNPSILFIFIGAIAMVIGGESSNDVVLRFLVFNMLGSISWFLSLIYFTSKMKNRMENLFGYISKYCPIMLIMFGIIIVIKTLYR